MCIPQNVINPGLKKQGNIDVNKRPIVRNPDGSISTVKSMSMGTDQGEVLIPTITPSGEYMSQDQSAQRFFDTNEHLGIFDTPRNAEDYAKRLSEAQGRKYGAPRDYNK